MVSSAAPLQQCPDESGSVATWDWPCNCERCSQASAVSSGRGFRLRVSRPSDLPARVAFRREAPEIRSTLPRAPAAESVLQESDTFLAQETGSAAWRR